MSGDPPLTAASDTAESPDDQRRTDLDRLARGSSLNLAGSFVSALLNLVVPVLITRALGPAEAGTFFAATALFTILVSVGSLGADTGLLRAIPRLRAQARTGELRTVLRVSFAPPAVFGTVLAILLLAVSPWAAGLVVGGGAAHETNLFVRFCYVLAPALPIAVLYAVALAASRGFGPVKPLVLVEKLGRSTAQAVLILVVQLLAPGAMLLILAWTAPYLAAAVVIGLWLRRLLARALRSAADSDAASRSVGELAREFWAFAAPRAISRIFSVALQRFDILLVSALRGPADAAVYTAASRFLIVGLMFVQAIQQVMAPKISELLTKDDGPRALAMYRTTTTWLTALSWPIYLMSAVFAPLLLGIFGDGYSRGAPVVVILTLTMLVATACGPVDTMLLMGGRSSLSLVNTGLALAVDVVLDLILVPRYGITGAAVGWMAAILVNNLLPLAQVQKVLHMHPFGAGSLRAAAMGLACFGAVPLAVRVLAGPTVPGLLVAGVLGTVLYAALLWWQREALELHALTAILRRGGGGGGSGPGQGGPGQSPVGPRRKVRARLPLHRLWRRATRVLRRRLLLSPLGRKLLRTRGRRLLVCIGDSHARIFERVKDRPELLPETVIDVSWVLGATALGLANPNSRTNALPIFTRAVRHLPRDATLLVMLGEVDCGYLLWYRAQTRDTSVDAEFEQSVVNYTAFLDSLLRRGIRDLVVAMVPPPTVEDYSTWAGLGNARSAVTASMQERTSITLAYNERLREWAATRGVRTLDFEADVLDPTTGVVSARFRNPDPLNHHLHHQPFAEVIAMRLNGLGFR